jgi:hypothetical protein
MPCGATPAKIHAFFTKPQAARSKAFATTGRHAARFPDSAALILSSLAGRLSVYQIHIMAYVDLKKNP